MWGMCVDQQLKENIFLLNEVVEDQIYLGGINAPNHKDEDR